ncbi:MULTISPECIES: TraR/DksA C4-type zinc finger protein [Yersinia]|uniref:TraR/DksA C4-type zinc finger protein n=1 Tax=Yersinia TaxID=629 RepID=UPI000C1456B9|nr:MULTISPECIES: TraR/DksA C4-type zinc finger protein [Yersinia]HEN3266814.1 TraR/DksA C4-type zinc finger protein [Yersinia enterocolitica]MDA5523330.1 TraR/DksA C4-type zinc finger protein [Yersinia kristensenii]MDA5544604.1 TraR/DksA C4-type zinc finger protein [Yersinia rochesterensis]PHZ36573.1 molecular chaperone DnaK [Yersinia kristensenii]UZM75977.1 TraR/DksA C4-type zinc finger protein [Yersinia sp. SCPM-O-B-9106 (C-191)]
MADDADYASELEQQVRDRIITAHTTRNRLPSDGICTHCGGDIEPKRLAIDPTFSRCITCQASKEKREAHVVRHY